MMAKKIVLQAVWVLVTKSHFKYQSKTSNSLKKGKKWRFRMKIYLDTLLNFNDKKNSYQWTILPTNPILIQYLRIFATRIIKEEVWNCFKIWNPRALEIMITIFAQEWSQINLLTIVRLLVLHHLRHLWLRVTIIVKKKSFKF